MLLGPRCAGKTSVALRLGAWWSRRVVDLDDVTAAMCGFSTPGEALRTLGEPAFRLAEADALRSVLLRRGPQVVALGGGTPLAPGARELLLGARASRRARLIYLHAPADVLRARLGSTNLGTRPALQGASALDEVEQVLRSREALYRELAQHVVDTHRLDLDGAAHAVATWVRGPTDAV